MRERGAALSAGFGCTVSAPAAARRLDRVVDNRRSIIDRLHLLPAPTQRARTVVVDMQDAFRESLAADRHSRDGFVAAGFELAKRAHVRATAAKLRFVTVVNALVSRVDRRTWSASEF